MYRVGLVIVDLGWVDMDLNVPPCCPAAKPIQPNFRLPKHNWVGSGMTRVNQTQSMTTSPPLYCLWCGCGMKGAWRAKALHTYLSFFLAGPEKRPHIPNKVVDQAFGLFRLEFTTVEVGSYVVDVNAGGLSVPGSPLIAKAYDAGLIKVTDIMDGVVGEMSTFRGV